MESKTMSWHENVARQRAARGAQQEALQALVEFHAVQRRLNEFLRTVDPKWTMENVGAPPTIVATTMEAIEWQAQMRVYRAVEARLMKAADALRRSIGDDPDQDLGK